MYFDHEIFGLKPSFTSILQLMHGGGGRTGGVIILNMDIRWKGMKETRGKKVKVMLRKSYEWQWKTN